MNPSNQAMLDHHGFNQDPFGTFLDGSLFCAAGGRHELVDKLQHLLTFSAQDAILLAPATSGKSTLAQQLLKKLPDDWRVAWVNAIEAGDLDRLVRELIGQLGLGLRMDGDIASLFHSINDIIRQRSEAGEFFLLIIENSDQLTNEVQSWLQSFRQATDRNDHRLRQLWLAQSDDQLITKDDTNWYPLELEGYTAEEAKHYLAERFQAAGIDFMPLADEDITRLNQQAKGRPGLLNTLVSEALTQEINPSIESKQGFPMPHVLAGVSVVILILLMVFYSRSDNPPPIEMETQAEAEPIIEQAAPVSEVSKRLAEAAAKIEARQTPLASTQPGPTTAPSPTQNQASTPAGTTATTDADTTKSIDDMDSPSEPQILTVQTPSITLASTPPTEIVAASQPITPATQIKETGLLATASDNEYTLQLLGVRDQGALEAIVAQLAEPSDYEIVKTRHQQKPWYVLIHGQYPSSASARNDIENLPEQFKEQGPWPRTFADLKASLAP